MKAAHSTRRKRKRRDSAAAAGRPERRRLTVLLGLLILAAALYAMTTGWRQRLREESRQSRRVIATVERAREARERRSARQRELENRLQTFAGDGDARLELAQLRWATAGPVAAAAVLEAGDEGDPRRAQMLAAVQRAAGREDLALAALDRALRAGPVAPWPGILRAERATLFTLMGWFARAEAELRHAEKHGAPPLQISLVRATMARQHVDLTTARRVLEAARARHPEDAEVIRQLAAVAEAERRFDEAARLLQSIAEREADPWVWVALARVALEAGGPAARADAAGPLDRALTLQPEMPAARLLLARSHRLGGEHDRARALLEPLCRENPRYGLALFELAQLYRRLGEGARARPLMARYQEHTRQRRAMLQAANAVMVNEESAAAHARMGRLCLDSGKIGRAILSFERALALDSNQAGARAALARARQAGGTGIAGDE